jgi:hypothetical protein
VTGPAFLPLFGQSGRSAAERLARATTTAAGRLRGRPASGPAAGVGRIGMTRSATAEQEAGGAAADAAGDRSGASAGGDTDPGRAGRQLWRRYRLPALGVLALLLVAVVIGLAEARSVHGELDPSAVDGEGSRALATLLTEREVDVRRVTRLDEALGGVSNRSIVLIPFPNLIPDDALRRIGAVEDGQVMLIGPDPGPLAAVTNQVTLAGTEPISSRAPDCQLDAATAAGAVEIGGNTYSVDGGEACYPAGGAATLTIAQTHGGARLVVLGTGSPLTNDRLARSGNAALALNLLGADGTADEVRWLVPSPGAFATGEELSVSDIAPDWVRPAALQLLAAAVLAALWRGRRLGPPVAEPLPVVVRAAESVEGRARLYRRAQARDRAADALRAGARSRLIPRLGLGRGAGGEPAPAAVVDAVGWRTRRSDAEVHAALYGPPPPDDATLVNLADSLDSIVRDTLDPEVRRP